MEITICDIQFSGFKFFKKLPLDIWGERDSDGGQLKRRAEEHYSLIPKGTILSDSCVNIYIKDCLFL